MNIYERRTMRAGLVTFRERHEFRELRVSNLRTSFPAELKAMPLFKLHSDTINGRRDFRSEHWLHLNYHERQSAFVSGLNSESISHYHAALTSP
jgi:hypothetical protein